MKLLKILSRIGIFLLILVAAVLVVRAVLNYTEGRALTRTLAELKARGIPLAAGDLEPPCSDENNGGRLLKAFENIVTFPGRQTAKPGPDERARRQRGFADREILTQAWNDLTEAKPWTAERRAALRDLIVKNQRGFELMAEIVEKPCFSYRDPGQSLIEGRIPDAVKTIAMTRLLLFSAFLDAEDGDMGSAIGKVRLGLRFAALPVREGPMIAFLIGVAETRMLAYYLNGVCSGRETAGEELVRLIADLDPRPWPGRLADGFRAERVFYVEAGGVFLRPGLKELGSIYGGPHWWQVLGSWILQPLVKRDMRRALPNFDFLEAQTAEPFYRSRAVVRSFDAKLKERPWYAVLSKTMFSEFETFFTKTAILEAILTTARTGLACRLYKSRTGRFPESLDALVPEILPEVPVDPFTGKPLVFRREGEGFIVYSLGSNEKDDGGRSTFNYTQLVMDKDDDWSWKEDR